MRTLAMTAALVTALTGTGCIVSTTDPQVGDADLRWRFLDYDGQPAGNWSQANTGCGVAAISTVQADVRLTVWDSFGGVVLDGWHPCKDVDGYPGVYLSSLPIGRYTYAVEAWRSGSPVFYGEDAFDVGANQVTLDQATLPVVDVAPLTIYFTQGGVGTCASTPYIRYDLYTPGNALIESTIVSCVDQVYGFTVTDDQPTGVNYSVDLFAIDALPPNDTSFYERCLQTVRHTGFPVTIDLLQAPQAACSGI